MDLDLGSYGIIDPRSSFCRKILWDHRSELVFFGGSIEIIDPMYTFSVRSTGIIDPDKKRPCGIQETQRKMKVKVLGHIYKK